MSNFKIEAGRSEKIHPSDWLRETAKQLARSISPYQCSGLLECAAFIDALEAENKAIRHAVPDTGDRE